MDDEEEITAEVILAQAKAAAAGAAEQLTLRSANSKVIVIHNSKTYNNSYVEF